MGQARAATVTKCSHFCISPCISSTSSSMQIRRLVDDYRACCPIAQLLGPAAEIFPAERPRHTEVHEALNCTPPAQRRGFPDSGSAAPVLQAQARSQYSGQADERRWNCLFPWVRGPCPRQDSSGATGRIAGQARHPSVRSRHRRPDTGGRKRCHHCMFGRLTGDCGVFLLARNPWSLIRQ